MNKMIRNISKKLKESNENFRIKNFTYKNNQIGLRVNANTRRVSEPETRIMKMTQEKRHRASKACGTLSEGLTYGELELQKEQRIRLGFRAETHLKKRFLENISNLVNDKTHRVKIKSNYIQNKFEELHF
jgi:hypothetical protein